MSLKYTVTADARNAIPSASIYSTIHTGIRHSSARKFSFIPDRITTANTTIKQSNIFTKLVVTVEMGKTSRGKYIFLTMSFCAIIDAAPPSTDDEKNIHGIRATKRKR